MKKVLKLENSLRKALNDADECWIAVAMISDYGLRFLEENVGEQCILNILVGINLPTPVSVLEKLKSLNNSEHISCKLISNRSFFHPKLYLIRKGDEYTAFLGSANFTMGGLKTNIELSFKIDEEELCKDLLENYFSKYFGLASNITDSFIESYRSIFERRKKRFKDDIEDIQSLVGTSNEELTLEKLNFDKQFFKYAHFDTFTEPKPIMDNADSDRAEVGRRLLELDSILWPQIKKKGWEIYRHPDKPHRHSTTSLAAAKAFNINKLKSVWLHYGKHKAELKDYKKLSEVIPQTFIHHIRLQVIIRNSFLGIWVVIGKNNGSHFDRDYFQKQMRESKKYREDFYYKVKVLGEPYEVHVAGQKKKASDFSSPKELWEYVKNDDIEKYFMMCRNYTPNSSEISNEKIASTIIQEFCKLIPIYNLVRHSVVSINS